MTPSLHGFAAKPQSPIARHLFAFVTLSVLLPLALLPAGCGRFRPQAQKETVYVVAQGYLRDRIAPVAANVVLVTNGEPLEVIEHNRRFLRVKTSTGAVGWIEDHLVITPAVYNQFMQLKEQHAHDSVVAKGILRDALYMHVAPSRTADRFYLLPENDKLQLLARTSVAKQNPFTAPQPGTLPPGAAGAHTSAAATPPPQTPPPDMEDWWLARDSQGRVGWLLARRVDMDVPDSIGGYSEGQKMVGAYVLTTVYDPESSVPGGQVPVYLAVLNSYHEGLPYDFNQFRVFTWNVKKHRYETAYRERGIEGYLPVKISQEVVDGQGAPDKKTPVPVFAIRVATSPAAAGEPAAGVAPPAQSEILRFALEGQVVKKISPASSQALVHPSEEHPHAVRRKPSARAHHRRGTGG